MNKKIVLLLTALSISSLPQQTYAAKQSEILIAIAATTILGVFGITFGISYGTKAAQHAKEQSDIALVTDVKMIKPYEKFSDIFSLIQESNNNKSDTTVIIAQYLASKRRSIEQLKRELSDYDQKNKQKIETLSKHIVLWRAQKTYDQKFIEDAQKAINTLEVSKQLEQTNLLYTFLKKEEVFLASFCFLADIQNKSYNCIHKQFPLIETVQEMHHDCEKLQRIIDDLTQNRESHRNDWIRYSNLIVDAKNAQEQLQTSITRITSSSDYMYQKVAKAEHDAQAKYAEIEKIKAQEKLLVQQRYQEKAQHLSSKNEQLVREKNILQEKFEKEQERVVRLQREINLLKEKIALLEQERSLLKSKSEQATQKRAEIEQKISALKEKVEEFLRKLKNPPFNPSNENVPKEAQYYIKLIGNFSFEGM